MKTLVYYNQYMGIMSVIEDTKLSGPHYASTVKYVFIDKRGRFTTPLLPGLIDRRIQRFNRLNKPFISY